MNEFLKRLGKTINKLFLMILKLFLLSVICALVVLVAIILPIWTLSFIIGSLAVYWVFFVFLVVVIMSVDWEDVKNKFNWLFIEPFNKDIKK